MAFFTLKQVQDADYLLRRAQEEAALGAAARDPRVAEAHDQLASRYLDRLFGSAGEGDARRFALQSRSVDLEVLKPIFERLGHSILSDQISDMDADPRSS